MHVNSLNSRKAVSAEGSGETVSGRSIATRYRLIVLFSITIARIVYSLNWFTLSPGLVQVSKDFNASLPSLGILESSFLVGAGLFQIPSAYGAAKWNAKSLVISGLALIALANGLAAFAPTFGIFVLLRFVLGIGVSMFFSPGIAVVAPLFRSESQGIALGLYNSAFSVGGAIALFGWSYFIQLYSWRLGLLIGAILAGIIALVNLVVIKHTERDGRLPSEPTKALKGVLKDRQVWLIAVGILGIWSAYYAVTQFLPFYETSVRSVDPYTAGLLASLLLIAPIPGALLGGWLSDRLRNRKAFMLYPTMTFAIGVMLIGLLNVQETFATLLILGLMDAFVFTSMYAAPFQMRHLALDQKAISISLMNSVQILGAFVTPIVFTLVASSFGYINAWLIVGVIAIVFVPLLAVIKEPFKMATDPAGS